MNADEIQLMREHNMTSNCAHCTRPVRQGIKYCDPYCTYSQIAKNQAEKEKRNDPRN